MNDLSVLLPLPQNTSELATMLAPTSLGRGGTLAEAALAVDKEFAGWSPPETLYVTALRFDPCVAELGPLTGASQCTNQLRLIFQSLAFPPCADGTCPPPSADDTGLHVSYSLTRDELIEAVTEIRDARVAATGDDDLGPLAPHPLIARDGLDGAFAQQLFTTITTYAGAANMVRETSFVGDNFDDFSDGAGWVFNGNDFAGSQATPVAIASLPDAAATEVTVPQTQTAVPLVLQTTPATTANDNIGVLVNATLGDVATAAQRQAAFDAAVRIENPNLHSSNTIDCASCHLAQPARQVDGAQYDLSASAGAKAFVAASWIPRADLVQTTPVIETGGDLALHAFSYLHYSPVINQRVINETARNLAYLAPLVK